MHLKRFTIDAVRYRAKRTGRGQEYIDDVFSYAKQKDENHVWLTEESVKAIRDKWELTHPSVPQPKPIKETLARPLYIEQRLSICRRCQHCVEGKKCGVLLSKGKPGVLLNPKGIPNLNAHCPIYEWDKRDANHLVVSEKKSGLPKQQKITTRNLIYHICPIGDWRDNVDSILKNKPIFNGRKVIAIAQGDNLEPISSVKDYISSLNAEVLILPNDPQLREAATFLPLLLAINNTNKNEATFYAHTKGNSTVGNREGAILWRNVMYDRLLGQYQTCMKHLRTHRFVGTHKQLWPSTAQPFPTKLQPKYRWMFCGTFWWFRHDSVFTHVNWRHIAADRYGVEAYPSTLYPSNEVKSVWQPWDETELAWPQLSPYEPRLYNQQ